MTASRARIWIALAAVYVIWGSTYLGILLAIRTIPVFLMGAIRFLVAGLILYAWSVRQGDRSGDRPGWRHWAAATVVGVALLVFGNTGVAWAEKHVATGTASLIIATIPLWMALFDRAIWGQRLRPVVVVGLVVGLAGAALLAGPIGPDRLHVAGSLVLVFAAISWALGSLWSRRAPLPRRPLVGASMEMIAGGAVLLLISVSLGEPGDVHDVSTTSILALVYLIVFGSLIGFTAYIWLLRAAPTTLVSTYAYVNPVVAVALGAAVENEPITARTVVAGGMILAAVALIVSGRSAPAPAPRARVAAPVRAR
jgi:drug/metabolite transporter (DMT)-like permease